jgi:hypothetical protein
MYFCLLLTGRRSRLFYVIRVVLGGVGVSGLLGFGCATVWSGLFLPSIPTQNETLIAYNNFITTKR